MSNEVYGQVEALPPSQQHISETDPMGGFQNVMHLSGPGPRHYFPTTSDGTTGSYADWYQFQPSVPANPELTLGQQTSAPKYTHNPYMYVPATGSGTPLTSLRSGTQPTEDYMGSPEVDKFTAYQQDGKGRSTPQQQNPISNSNSFAPFPSGRNYYFAEPRSKFHRNNDEQNVSAGHQQLPLTSSLTASWQQRRNPNVQISPGQPVGLNIKTRSQPYQHPQPNGNVLPAPLRHFVPAQFVKSSTSSAGELPGDAFVGSTEGERGSNNLDGTPSTPLSSTQQLPLRRGNSFQHSHSGTPQEQHPFHHAALASNCEFVPISDDVPLPTPAHWPQHRIVEGDGTTFRAFVGQVRFETTAEQVAHIIEQASGVVPAYVAYHRVGCFVAHFSTSDECQKAVEYHRRIYFDLTGVWIARTEEALQALQQEIKSVSDGPRKAAFKRQRLPRGAMVLEPFTDSEAGTPMRLHGSSALSSSAPSSPHYGAYYNQQRSLALPMGGLPLPPPKYDFAPAVDGDHYPNHYYPQEGSYCDEPSSPQYL